MVKKRNGMAKPIMAIEEWAMQDSNPRRRVRSPSGYPDYPNRPKGMALVLTFEINGQALAMAILTLYRQISPNIAMATK